MNETRSQIVELLLEMRQLPDCIPYDWQLRRDYTTISDTLNISQQCDCESLITFFNKFCEQHSVNLSDVFVQPVDVDVPYEDYTDDGVEISITVKESDAEYLARLKQVYAVWLKLALKPISSVQWSVLFHSINSTLYTARNITMNSDIIVECLDDLGRIYNVINNDSNGQATVADMYLYARRVYTELAAKYC